MDIFFLIRYIHEHSAHNYLPTFHPLCTLDVHFSQDQSEAISEEISTGRSKRHENRHSFREIRVLSVISIGPTAFKFGDRISSLMFKKTRGLFLYCTACALTYYVLTEYLPKNELVICGNYMGYG